MRAIAAAVSVPPEKPGFSCYDPTLAQRLTQAADQAEQPAELKLREAVFNEGPAGVANAVKNLWRNIGAYSSSLVSYVSGGGSDRYGRTGTGEPITGRDLIALLATIGVDLGLLALAILNPPPAESRRPPEAVARQIRDAINTAVRSAPGEETNLNWVRRHFVHHNNASYLVIPNLYSAGRAMSNEEDKKEAERALAMNQLAGVLSDLELVRWPEEGWPKRKPTGLWPEGMWRPKKSELEFLQLEETAASATDLTETRKAWIARKTKDNVSLSKYDEKFKNAEPLRNHGLFSKAERALSAAGWSEDARRDIEIFRVVETDGLTPLLMVLNEETTAAGSGTQPAQRLASQA
jgi:hypothetical protein